MTEPTAPDLLAEPFDSLTALRIAHLDMLNSATVARGEPVPEHEVEAFLARASATGAGLQDADDRETAQRILDYWSADLLSAARPRRTSRLPTALARYRPPPATDDKGKDRAAPAAPLPGGAGNGELPRFIARKRPPTPQPDHLPSKGGTSLPSWVGRALTSLVSSAAPTASAPAAPAPPDAVRPPEQALSPDEARQYIRLSAQARQWRDTGSAGYLLSGGALSEATKFTRDADVAALVEASQAAERQAERLRARMKNWLLATMALVIVALAGVTWYAHLQAVNARVEAAHARVQTGIALEQSKIATEQGRLARLAQHAAEQAQQMAEANRDHALEESANAKAASEEAARLAAQSTRDLARTQQLLDRLGEANRTATARLAELETKQQVLDAALGSIADAVVAGKLALADLPPDLRDTTRSTIADRIANRKLRLGQLDGELAAEVRPLVGEADLSVFDRELPGYDPGFLGLPLPIPDLPRDRIATALNNGAPVDYLHYSLVMDARRRLAVVSAANLNRALRVVLPRSVGSFGADPRLSPDVQPEPGWFGAGLDRGALVGRNDVSWGKDFGGDPAEAAARLAQLVDVAPNTLPQYAEVNRTAWRLIDDWIWASHNPDAAQVTIFAGPVFSGDGGPVPAAFWKIAVSVRPTSIKAQQAQKAPAEPDLAIDAFLVPNRPRGEVGPPVTAAGFRTTVEDIARATGLGFDARILAADRQQNPAYHTRGDLWVEALGGLDAADAATRKALTQRVVDFLRDRTQDRVDQRKVAAALVAMAAPASFAELRPEGRVNLLFLLSEVPAEDWQRADWLPVTAAARQAAVALSNLSPPPGADAQRYLPPWRSRIELAPSPDQPRQTVQLHFADLTRDRAQGIADQLAALGWTVLPPDRNADASGRNQVRYHPGDAADAAAAALLAADLTAAGQAGADTAEDASVASGVLALWISP